MTFFDQIITRRRFMKLLAGLLCGSVLSRAAPTAQMQDDWRGLLPYYDSSARSNIETVGGQRALLSARLYPGTYVRDAVFWGPLGLDDPALGFECYQWFAESSLPDGQIRTAVPLRPDDASQLVPQDDEGSLLFIVASDWLSKLGFVLDRTVIKRAYYWVQTHVSADHYLSPPGPFRYWADTVDFDSVEMISHNQGLLCLARRALLNMGFGRVSAADVDSAVAVYRSSFNHTDGYVSLGKFSRFAGSVDVSAIFPEFLSRYLYGSAMLPDEMVMAHAEYVVNRAAVYYPDGRIAGLKIIAAPSGDFLPPEWYHAPQLNQPGHYQNGGHWPLYSIVTLALAYSISRDERYGQLIGELVAGELGEDHQSKEVIRLAPGGVGTFDPARMNYTWNVLIPTACRWCGLA